MREPCPPDLYYDDEEEVSWYDEPEEVSNQITYFIQQGHDGPIKIGIAVDVERRIKQLQTSSPVPLRLLGVVRRDIEAELHGMFRDSRLSGEWFRSDDERLIQFILTNAEISDTETQMASVVQCIKNLVRDWTSAMVEALNELHYSAAANGRSMKAIRDFDRTVASLSRLVYQKDFAAAYGLMVEAQLRTQKELK